MEDQNLQSSATSGSDKTVKGPKALFWYLTMFFTLGFAAFALGGIWFQYINSWFPQEVSFGSVRNVFNQGALKFSIASLLIAAPIFFLFAYIVRKSLNKGTLDVHNKIRTWVTYIILFLTIAIALGDLIATVFRLLDGDFTPRFLLKSLTILVIVGWIFVYYGLELKSPTALAKEKTPLIFGGIAGALMVVSIIGAFFIVDSPTEARLRSFDNRRAEDLQNIRYAIEGYYVEREALPESLASLQSDYQRSLSIVDPKTDQPYEYQTTGEQSYQLCGTFETSNKDMTDQYDQGYYYTNITHDVGRTCFDYVIQQDPSLAPVRTKPVPIE